ncbi:hypothetical protein B0H10DRAFT_579367 [Mycena sp. CBHHK59/15]|nr:hypothetical protein B0H10DRAFT_579367 [Mycena sp. CBHHK59/15]
MFNISQRIWVRTRSPVHLWGVVSSLIFADAAWKKLPAHTLPRPRHGRSQRGCRGCAPHSGCCQYCQRTCLVNNDGTLPTLIVHQIGGRPFTLHSIPPPPPLCLL